MTSRVLGRIVVVAAVLAGGVGAGRRFWTRPEPGGEAGAVPAMAMPAPASSPDPRTPRGDVVIDTRRQQLIGVRTVKAARAGLGQTLRTSGVVRYDETRVTDINVRLEGWVRDLDADYTGRAVERGARLLSVSSPGLLVAEQEFVVALAGRDALRASVTADARARADAIVSAGRRRLQLLDVDEAEVRRLEETRQASDIFVVRAPESGVLIEKQVTKAAHIAPGQTLYKLADLSVVWVEASVYEQDLPVVRVGDRAEVELEAYPGERQVGRVVYVYPYLDEATRTNRVRYEFPNALGRLKPGMYATVNIGTRGGTGITVPADAVLDSGREQLVFVAEGDGRFTPRPVTVGRRLGASVQILKGLTEGEEVAVAAAFFLDSESQLRGAVQNYAPAAASSAPATADSLRIAVRTTPDPPRTGENQFDVSVTNADGSPVSGADVTIELFMPAMPTMNMPAMRNTIPLAAAGNAYRGTGQVMMAGSWDLTVVVARAGQRLGAQRSTLVAK